MKTETEENLSREEIREVQLLRLQNIVKYVYNNVTFYKKKLDEKWVRPEDIKKLEDIKMLPFTTKQDLRDNYPYNMFAVPMKDIVRLHASSGTTGSQTIVGYTQKDLDTWADIIATDLRRYGVNSDDLVQVAYGYGMFTGGIGIHYGVEKLGAAVIPMSGGNTEKQVMTMKNFGTTVLACTPSYALHIYDTMLKMGVSPDDLKLRVGIFGAEPWSDEIRTNIERKFGIKAYDIYGLSEVMGPGVAGECCMQNGLHINETNFLPEVINPETLESCKEGEVGELVFTTLTKEGIPLLRYRTKDMTSLNYEKCECGCSFARINRVYGRNDDMMIIRGVNVYPIQIEKVLFNFKELSPHYLLHIETKGNLDQLTISVEMTNYIEFYDEEYLIALKNNILQKLYSQLQIHCKIEFVDPETIARTDGKSKRIVHERELVLR